MSDPSVISRLAALQPWRAKGAAALVLTAALLGTSSLPAKAQFFNFWGGRSYTRPSYPNEALPPVAIFDILSRQGYRFVSTIQRRGQVYLADVVNPDGARAHVVIDSFDGTVLQSFAAAPLPRAYIPEPDLRGPRLGRRNCPPSRRGPRPPRCPP
jgi:hypothetical protein